MKTGLDDYILKNLQHIKRQRAAARAALDHAQTKSRADRSEKRLDVLWSRLKVCVFRRKPGETGDGRYFHGNTSKFLHGNVN